MFLKLTRNIKRLNNFRYSIVLALALQHVFKRLIELTCCSSPNRDPDMMDLGCEDTCDFMLGRCSNCDAYWLNVFCY